MSKSEPLHEDIPKACPKCQAKLPIFGKSWDQKRAVSLRMFAGALWVGCTIVIITMLYQFSGRIRVGAIMGAAGVSMIPAGVLIGMAGQIPKIKEIRCGKCRWTEWFYFSPRQRAG